MAVLAATLSTDLTQRKAAEDYLTQFSYAKGHVVGLMQVAVAAQAELPMRQAASIQFKTLVGKGWDPRGEASARQGLTPVHFPAQLEHFVWDRGCA